jgi:hypothetical protein
MDGAEEVGWGLALLFNFPKQGVAILGRLSLAQHLFKLRTITERELRQQIFADASGGGCRGGWDRFLFVGDRRRMRSQAHDGGEKRRFSDGTHVFHSSCQDWYPGASDSGFRTAMQNRGVIMPLVNALSGGQLRIG